MPVDIASYRRWEGRARPTRTAALAIAATMVRRRMRHRLVRFIILAFTIAACLLSGIFFLLLREGETHSRIQRQISQLGLENVNMLALLNRLFTEAVGFWAILLAAVVGAPLIAEDRRARALPLYFSRPIGHVEYVLGKALAAAFFLALLLVLPRLCMYGIEAGFSKEGGAAGRQLGTLLASCATGGLGVVVLTAIALGVSSLTDRPTYGALFLLGLTVLSVVVGQILARQIFHDASWLAVSPWACVQRVGMDLLDVPEQLRIEGRLLREMPLDRAWLGLGLWTAAGFATLVVRVRRVEVVT